MLYVNESDESRVWPAITVDGQTLELEPGAEAELELPEDFDDPYLKPKGKTAAKPKGKTADAEPTTAETEEPHYD